MQATAGRLFSAILLVAMAGRRHAGDAKGKEISDQAAGDRRPGQLLHRRRAKGHQLRDGAPGERCQPGAGSQSDHDRSDVRPVRDSANQETQHAPVIMVHGSSHTAACLESTPDGREGWYPYFVRKGISTYLVDQAGRGRSGFDESVINEAAAMIKNGDIAKGLRHDACLWQDHRQWRLDGTGSAT